MDTSISTVANSIAALSVTGVTIKDIHDMPITFTRLVPLLTPNPDNFVTNYSSVRDTFGSSTAAQKTVEYDLNYIFVLCDAASGRAAGLDFYDEMIAKIEAILDVLHDNDTLTGVVDIMPQGINNLSIEITDPTGQKWLGCDLIFHCIEYE